MSVSMESVRKFIAIILQLLMLLLGAGTPVQPLLALPPPENTSAQNHIGVYLTATSAANQAFMEQTMRKIHEVGGSAIVIDVKDERKPGLAQSKEDLQKTVRKAKEQGLRTIARFIVFKDTGLAHAVPETQLHDTRTKKSFGATWVDPAHPLVLAYNRKLLTEVIEAGFDEVSFDYIRYPTEYSPERIGLTTEEKIRRIEQFLRMARETIDSAGVQTKLGISTYAILALDFEGNIGRLGQDFVRFAPFVDVISPMAYPKSFGSGFQKPRGFPRSRNFYLVQQTLEGYKRLLGPASASKLRPWIQGYSMTPWDIGEEIDAVAASDLCGFTVWNPSNSYQTLYTALPAHKQPEKCL